MRIEEKLAGWSLDGGAQAKILAAVKVFPNTPYDLYVNPTSAVFMETVDGILQSAGWKRNPPKAGTAFAVITMNNKANINYNLSGIHVVIALPAREKFEPAATAFALSLRDAGIPAELASNPQEPDDTAVHVFIGSK